MPIADIVTMFVIFYLIWVYTLWEMIVEIFYFFRPAYIVILHFVSQSQASCLSKMVESFCCFGRFIFWILVRMPKMKGFDIK